MSDLSLPKLISPDGKEIWDWAARICRAARVRSDIGDLRLAIINLKARCGSCNLWMTQACPREVNNSGRKSGPSMSGSVCSLFSLTKLDSELIAEKEKRIAELEKELSDEKGTK